MPYSVVDQGAWISEKLPDSNQRESADAPHVIIKFKPDLLVYFCQAIIPWLFTCILSAYTLTFISILAIFLTLRKMDKKKITIRTARNARISYFLHRDQITNPPTGWVKAIRLGLEMVTAANCKTKIRDDKSKAFNENWNKRKPKVG